MTSSLLTHTAPATSVVVTLVTPASLKKWEKDQSAAVANWFKANSFTGKAGTYVKIPGADGKLSRVVISVHDPVSMWDLAALPSALPKGTYVLDGCKNSEDERKLALGWLLGCYRYALYKKNEVPTATLCLSKKLDLAALLDMADSIASVRTLITTPPQDMGPAELAAAATVLAKKHKAKITTLVGDQLLKKNYPAIHAVGRGSPREPRLIDMVWGNEKHPKVTLVGKGVCFDTGGLDIKPGSAMYLMRKDMAGAAVVLGLANMIMQRKLPIRLRVLIPAIENSVDGHSFRPSDVIKMRNGLTVEVGNTDAEGRLVLADALTEACSEKPALLINFATLTGAARAAVGTDIAALMTNTDSLADALYKAGQQTEDNIWRLPLHAAYDTMLDSSFADVNSCPNSSYAGAITAGLFLQRFVEKSVKWVHLDFMGWNTSKKPGRPEGGEAMTLRAVFALLEKMYAKK